MTLAIVLLSWFAILMMGSLFVERLWCRALGRGFRIFVAPGVIVHEYSHVLACLLMGARIEKIALFEKTGGYVRHSIPKIPKWPPVVGPSIGMVVISFAPIFGCLAAIGATFALMYATNPAMRDAAETVEGPQPVLKSPTSDLPQNEQDALNAAANNDMGGAVANAANMGNTSNTAANANNNTAGTANEGEVAAPVNHAGESLTNPVVKEEVSGKDSVLETLEKLASRTWSMTTRFGEIALKADWIGIIGIYFMLSFVICMNPSKKDFDNSKMGWMILLVVIVGACLIVGQIPAPNHGDMMVDVQLVNLMVVPIGFTLALLIIASLVTLVIAAPVAGIRRGMAARGG